MIPSSTVSKSGPHTGNGSTNTWDFSFKVFSGSEFSDSNVRIILTDANGVETDITSNYSTALNADQDANPGGTLTYPVSGTYLSFTQTITISSNVPITQGTDYQQGGTFNAQTVEDRLDWLTLVLKQQAEIQGRSIRFPISVDASAISTEIPNATNKILSLDDNGNIVAVREMGTFEGDWAAGKGYVTGDMVKAVTVAAPSSKSTWWCVTNHTSSGAVPLDTNTDYSKWELLVDAEQVSLATAQAVAAAASATLASEWATKTSGVVSGSEYSAKYHAQASAASATASAGSVTSASTALSNFEANYLGKFTADPTQDNDGGALQTGMLYGNTTNGVLKLYNGTAWANASTAVSGVLQPYTFTLTDGQTVISDNDDNSVPLVIDDASLVREVNYGDSVAFVPLDSGDYTIDAANNKITLTTGATVGKKLSFVVFGDFSAQSASQPRFGDVELAAIDASITATAVDLFVYQTSKDSDGGAWRKRTQGTSWYNETLNTSTRGSRKEFPSVAVIVAESSQVTIYDGDDPDMPMWMVFPTGGILDWSTSTVSDISVAAMNGQIVVGTNDGGTVWKFISDYIDILYHGTYDLTSNRTIAGRGDTTVFTSGGDNNIIIVHYDVNDVAMTVLPNNGLDSSTGLPSIDIAVATDGNGTYLVSLIKADGNVYDIGTDGGYTCTSVAIKDKQLTAVRSDGTVFIWDDISQINTDGVSPTTTITDTLGTVSEVADKYLGSSDALTIVSDAGTAFVSSEFNTGYMVGDIKLAALSDTDDTDVTGSELVTNGTFDSNTSGWSSVGATLTHSSGGIVNSSTGYNSYAYQNLTLTAGKSYVLTADLVADTQGGGGAPRLAVSEGASDAGILASTVAFGVGSYTVHFVSTGAARIRLIKGGNAGSQRWDNVSLRLADPDRSVNNNGLQVFGTITKTAVASGADLVGYATTSSGNYMNQVNSDVLAVSTTEDFCISFWWNNGPNSGDIVPWYFGTYAGSDSIGFLFYHSAGQGGKYIFKCGSSNIFSDTTHLYAGWKKLDFVRRSNTLMMFVDGVKQNGTASNSVSFGNKEFVLGSDDNHSYHTGVTRLSLFRITHTAPTDTQFKKDYEDEKVLFQENAKAVLAGTSDEITALAYDDSHDELLAGTSQYTSVFRGLRRVEAIAGSATAISASNGLRVIED